MKKITLNQVIKAIDKAKTQVIMEAQVRGIVEGFGQQAVNKIKSKYCPSNWCDVYSNRDIAVQAENLVQNFDEWASRFSLWDLQHGKY